MHSYTKVAQGLTHGLRPVIVCISLLLVFNLLIRGCIWLCKLLHLDLDMRLVKGSKINIFKGRDLLLLLLLFILFLIDSGKNILRELVWKSTNLVIFISIDWDSCKGLKLLQSDLLGLFTTISLGYGLTMRETCMSVQCCFHVKWDADRYRSRQAWCAPSALSVVSLHKTHMRAVESHDDK